MSPTVPPTSTITTSVSGDEPADRRLDLVGDVRNHLHRRAEEFAAALLGDDVQVDATGRDVVRLRQRAIDESLVVAEIEIRLGAVVGDEHFAVLERRHRARIDVEVRIELEHRDAQPALDEQPPERRGGDALAERRDHAAGDEDVLGRVWRRGAASCMRCHPVVKAVHSSVRALEILFRIDSRPDRLVDQRDAHRDSGGQRPKLLEPLDLLRADSPATRPSCMQRVRRVRVHADVLPDERSAAVARRPRSRRNGIGAREKYIARPSSAATTFTTFGSRSTPRGASTAAVPSGNRASVTSRAAPSDRRARHERLVALHVDDRRRSPRTPAAARPRRRDRCRRDGASLVMTTSPPCSRADVGDLVAVGRDDDSGRRRRSTITRSQTRTTSGRPARRRSGFRGRRVAPSRAGMTASVLIRGARGDRTAGSALTAATFTF